MVLLWRRNTNPVNFTFSGGSIRKIGGSNCAAAVKKSAARCRRDQDC
jgi:hypothetical protein